MKPEPWGIYTFMITMYLLKLRAVIVEVGAKVGGQNGNDCYMPKMT